MALNIKSKYQPVLFDGKHFFERDQSTQSPPRKKQKVQTPTQLRLVESDVECASDLGVADGDGNKNDDETISELLQNETNESDQHVSFSPNPHRSPPKASSLSPLRGILFLSAL